MVMLRHRSRMDRERVLVDTSPGRRNKLIQALSLWNVHVLNSAHIGHGAVIGETLAVYTERAGEATAVLYSVAEQRIMGAGTHLIELGGKRSRQFRAGSACGTFAVQPLM